MKPNIVCLGGGTGTFVVLSGLVETECNLSAIVSMSDSGGSNKRIRDEFGLLPTSDIRQCLVALSREQGRAGLLRKLFMYRFEKGNGITGMTFGNLFMAALSDILGSQKEAICQTGKVLRIHGKVIPVSFTHTNLIATYDDGTVVSGEHEIDEPTQRKNVKIHKVKLSPPALANGEAISSIKNADCIVIGPVDLYTSVIPNLLVNGIPEAIQTSKGICVYIVNLMTKNGQTLGYSASDHVRIVESYIGKRINYVLFNTAPLPQNALRTYASMSEYPVRDDLTDKTHYKVLRGDIVSDHVNTKSKSDQLIRSLIRHDGKKLAGMILSIINNSL